jgi:hypothetical protein
MRETSKNKTKPYFMEESLLQLQTTSLLVRLVFCCTEASPKKSKPTSLNHTNTAVHGPQQ